MYEPVPIDQLQPGLPGYLWLLVLAGIAVAAWGLYTALERRADEQRPGRVISVGFTIDAERFRDGIRELEAVTVHSIGPVADDTYPFRVVPDEPPEVGFDTPVADILDTDPGGHRW